MACGCEEQSPAAAVAVLTPRQRLIAQLAPAERERVCRIEELLGDDSPVGIIRAVMAATGLFVPASGCVGRFYPVLAHFGFQALPARVSPPAVGDIYVGRGTDEIGFVTHLWQNAGEPAAGITSFESFSAEGQQRVRCEEVDFWLRLPGEG